jgi:hypothetical protein
MKKRRRRDIASLSLSFLDAVTCGFGAVILLLVLTKVFEPVRLEESNTELDGLIVKYEQELRDILGETDRVRRQRLSTENEVEIDSEQIAELEAELTRIRAAYQSEQSEAEIAADLAGQMATAKQTLTEEMERLLGSNRPRPEDYKIGGIPVDSEYIIFLIDTSGSMQRFEWDRVNSTLRETLDIYPTVKGIQVLNDQGNHLLESFRNEWIPDTPTNRQWILDELETWQDYSESNPRRGILSAIDRYYDPNKKISLYVYSDDFSSGWDNINGVITEIDQRNSRREDGEQLVRIHAVAFPVFYDVLGVEQFFNSTGAAFGVMMRIICMRNGGTFVGLPSRHRV